MNIATEPKLAGKPIDEKGRARPVRMVRWFIIIGLALVLVAGGIVYFEYWREAFLKNMFATMKPPPATVTVAEATSEVVPNLLTAVGGLAAVHQVNVT
jgi:multidrug efflux system membrane fusion protein